MIEVIKYTEERKKDWGEFVRQSKNGWFMFERGYMDYHRDRFEDYSLIIEEDGKIVALLPANIRDGVLYSHQGLTFGGFITNRKMRAARMLEVFLEVKKYLKEQGVSEIIYKVIPHIYHKNPAEEDLYALFRNEADLFRVDVSTTIDLKNQIAFSNGKKTGITKAQKEGLEVLKTDDFKSFFEMVENRLEEKYETEPTHTAEEMELLNSRFPENIILYGVFKEGEMVAGVLVYISETVAHAQYISSNEEGRDLRAVDLAVGHLIKNVYTDKKYFDFGISNENSGRALNEGLISQKEEFGGRSVVLQTFKMKT